MAYSLMQSLVLAGRWDLNLSHHVRVFFFKLLKLFNHRLEVLRLLVYLGSCFFLFLLSFVDSLNFCLHLRMDIFLTFRLLLLSFCIKGVILRLILFILVQVEILFEAWQIVLGHGLLSAFKANFVHNLLNLGLMSLQQFCNLFELFQDPRVSTLEI